MKKRLTHNKPSAFSDLLTKRFDYGIFQAVWIVAPYLPIVVAVLAFGGVR